LQQRSLDRRAHPQRTILEPKYSASGLNYGGKLQIAQESDLDSLITLSGIFLAEIQVIGMSWEPGDGGRWLDGLHEMSELITDSFVSSEQQLEAVWRTAVADQEIRQGREKPRLSMEKAQKIDKVLRSSNLGLVDSETFISTGTGDYWLQLKATAQGRRPFVTSGRHLGVGPQSVEPGDFIFILIGSEIPYVLRRYERNNIYHVIGEAYVHGIMDGEVMERDPIIRDVMIG
jgi:hypothetical protein